MKVTILGIDLAKNVFRLHGVDAEGRRVLRKQLAAGSVAALYAAADAVPGRTGGLS
jgi:transposase